MTKTVTLKPVSENEFAVFAHEMDEAYIAVRARVDRQGLEAARTFALKQIGNLRPQGMHTPGHSFHHIDFAGTNVGRAWLYVEGSKAFLYDIEIWESARGQGLGRAAMEALETFARQHGAREFQLNVFGFNTVAQQLYLSQGFEVLSMGMGKRLV